MTTEQVREAFADLERDSAAMRVLLLSMFGKEGVDGIPDDTRHLAEGGLPVDLFVDADRPDNCPTP